ncbi:HGL209Wp [Eremothecium sinecaudum]|uniref:HGL209Wp n=1 Tax=Eremothecium sinecaudum TaxID=45286 RepID=A0A0X8HV80_9SACH|nr:HGL209Wp [Eremothecium sinecaudum]AMD22131.1 HGL209Wp [Eremothecium sinecaudum]
MGNSDSKLAIYKAHLAKLADVNDIPIYSSLTTSQAASLFYKRDLKRDAGGVKGKRPIEEQNQRQNGLKNQGNYDDLKISSYNLQDTASCTSATADTEPNLSRERYNEFFACLAKEQFSAEDIYSLLTVQELRHIFTSNSRNYQNFVRFACFKVCSLTAKMQTKQKDWASFQDNYNELLNCVRILTKILPVFFETDTEQVLEDAIMWSRNSSEILGFNTRSASTTAATVGATVSSAGVENGLPGYTIESPQMEGVSPVLHDDPLAAGSANSLHVAVGKYSAAETVLPLGVLLMESCINLLFMEGFTLPIDSHNKKNVDTSSPMPTDFYGKSYGRVSFLLWEKGISIADYTEEPPNPMLDSHRLEVLRLILTLCSKNLYQPDCINKYLLVLCTTISEYSTICVISSMINLICKYCEKPDTDHYAPHYQPTLTKSSQLNALRKSLVMTCFSVLNIMLNFRLASETESPGTYKFLYSLNVFAVGQILNHVPKAYLSSLEKESDMNLILYSLAKVIKSPMDIAVDQECNPFNWTTPKSSDSRGLKLLSGLKSTSQGKSHSLSGSPQSKRGTPYESHSTIPPDSAGSTGSVSFNHSSVDIFSLNLQAIVLMWELMKCSKKFEEYVADKYGNRLVVISVFYMKYYKDLPEHTGTLLPLIGGFATYLTSKNLILYRMMDPIDLNYYSNKIPNMFKLSATNINTTTYRDFCVVHLSNIAAQQIKKRLPLKPCILELIYNLLPLSHEFTESELEQISTSRRYTQPVGLSYQAATGLSFLLSKMANMDYISLPSKDENNVIPKAYSYSSGAKLDNLALFLRAILTYIIYYYQDSKNLLFTLCRHEKIIYQLNDIIQEYSEGLNANDLRNLYAPQESDQDDVLIDMDVMNQLGAPKSTFPGQTSLYFRQESDKSNTDQKSDGEVDYSESELDSIDEQKTPEGYYENLTAGGKSVKIYEHLDYSEDTTLKSTKLYLNLRPIWPVGLTVKGKWKTKLHKPLYVGWIGAPTLFLLMKVVQIVNNEFPQIAHIKSKEYYDLLKHIGAWEPTFQDYVKPLLSPEILAMNESYKSLDLDWDSNAVASKWYRSVIWSNIFNANSVPYLNEPLDHKESSEAITDVDIVQTPSQRGFPEVKIQSEGPTLTTTNSNSSSLAYFDGDYFANSVRSSPSYCGIVERKDSSSASINNIGLTVNNMKAAEKLANPKKASSSLFKLSWLGFVKNESSDAIDEEFLATSTNTSPGKRQFALDAGVLKPNIWVGTRIAMFKVKREAKEEFSLIELTGSFFRHLRTHSSANNTDTPNIRYT